MAEIVGSRVDPALHWQQIWTIFAIFCITLIGTIRILLPVSLGSGRKAIWAQPILIAVGFAVLFLAMNLATSLPSPRRLAPKLALWIKWLILITCSLVLIYFSLPRRTSVLPAQPRPADSLVMLLAVAAILMFAVFGSCVVAAEDAPAYAVLLPAIAVAGFFGLTRDLGIALALFCASIAVLVSGSRPKSTKADSARAGRAEIFNRPALFIAALASLFIFAAGAVLTIVFGRLFFHIPQFGYQDVLGYSDRQPLPFIAGKNLLLGPGLYAGDFQQWRGAPGSAPDVLALIGHETGLLGLVGVILVFFLLFASLTRLAVKVEDPTAAAVAWGLIVFLIVQGLLAAETLIPHLVPAGNGPPLLSGGWADYLADLIALGIVIGLSRRPTSTAVPESRPVQMNLAPASTHDLSLETYANNE
jgi:cell division protein FtsW (lipid II flippase)